MFSSEIYPPFPWHLHPRGLVLATLHRADVERARAFVPPDIPVLSVFGKTMGGLFVAEYGHGSDLEYNELIAVGAVVLFRGRPAAWATHVYVDHPASVEGGRTLLGVPKQMASFTRDSRGVTVQDDAHCTVCRLRHDRPLWLWRQRVRGTALHRDVRDPFGGTVVAHGNEFRGRIGLVGADVVIPPESPLRGLGLSRPLLGLCAQDAEAVFGARSVSATHPASVAAPPAACGSPGAVLPP